MAVVLALTTTVAVAPEVAVQIVGDEEKHEPFEGVVAEGSLKLGDDERPESTLRGWSRLGKGRVHNSDQRALR